MAQTELHLDLPADVIALLGETPEEATNKAKQAVVLELLREGRISQGTAARVLGVSRHDIIDLMAEHDIPSGPATPEELRQDIQNAERFLAQGEAPAT
jgi:predicted HTH domain antitoxin